MAVLDTGVNVDTPDLAGRILPAMAPSGVPILDGISNTHGTRMASTIAMGVNNDLGGAGVGNFSILPVTVTDAQGSNTPLPILPEASPWRPMPGRASSISR